jgi:KaiC/GvpD/RAD55 family RecA-like ATPase
MNNLSTLEHLKTGSEELDQLLAPHPSFDSLENFVALSYPFHIPKGGIDPHAVNGGKRGAGIPFGIVTEFSGPPSCGKTQLSLNIIARSVMQHVDLRVLYLLSGGHRKAVSRRLFSLCVEVGRHFGFRMLTLCLRCWLKSKMKNGMVVISFVPVRCW